jgi:transcriptional regulator with XRE-family HTH domain
MSVGNVIKAARLKKSIKQSTVAKEVGVTVQTYIKWENDETEPKASQVAKLGAILGISNNSICLGLADSKMELTGFIRYFSKVVSHANDFEVGLTIWENIQNDYDFINKLRKNAGIAFEPAYTEYDPERDEVIFLDANNNEITDPLFENN